jgi:hypothetical protein
LGDLRNFESPLFNGGIAMEVARDFNRWLGFALL